MPSGLTLSKIETIELHHYNDVSSQVSVKKTHMTYNPATKLYRCNLEITNNGPALKGNIYVVLDGIINLQGIGNADNQYSTTSPKITSKIANKPATGKNSTDPGLLTDVTLVNATGSNNGEPMIKARNAGLDSGDSMVVQLQFSNPDNSEITFTPVVLDQ
jgi:hypothetical protein